MYSDKGEEMNIAIVGASNTFMKENHYTLSFRYIEGLVSSLNIVNDKIISGHSPKGGIDIIAEEIARKYGYTTENGHLELFIPQINRWGNLGKKIGYKSRNILIAQNCDELYNLVVGCVNCWCYHCKCYGHRRSGGCWTMMKAKEFNKKVHQVIL